MNKILVIPDTHGKIKWFDLILSFKNFDKIIFLGDYFDSFDESIENQITGFFKVVELIKSNPEKYIALLGNHDMQYLKPEFMNYPIQCSGFQTNQNFRIYSLLKENLKLFKIAHQENLDSKTVLFSHAGVTTSLIKECLRIKINKPYEDIIDEFMINKNIAGLLNFCLIELNLEYLHWCGKSRGGNNKFSGPFWCGLKELENDCIQNSYLDFVQVVGHTRIETPYKGINNNYFVDSMNKQNPQIIQLNNLWVIN
jgi:predicted phosphodiesterase